MDETPQGLTIAKWTLRMEEQMSLDAFQEVASTPGLQYGIEFTFAPAIVHSFVERQLSAIEEQLTDDLRAEAHLQMFSACARQTAHDEFRLQYSNECLPEDLLGKEVPEFLNLLAKIRLNLLEARRKINFLSQQNLPPAADELLHRICTPEDVQQGADPVTEVLHTLDSMNESNSPLATSLVRKHHRS